jgi:hypothetical protein
MAGIRMDGLKQLVAQYVLIFVSWELSENEEVSGHWTKWNKRRHALSRL